MEAVVERRARFADVLDAAEDHIAVWFRLLRRRIDVLGGESRQPAFLALNPRGQLPVLEDGPLRLPDAQAILVYLASRYDPQRRWYPDDPATRGRITLWLATADEITRTVSAARLHLAFGYPADLAACQRAGRAVALFASMM
jgi:glutathione S-transferase